VRQYWAIRAQCEMDSSMVCKLLSVGEHGQRQIPNTEPPLLNPC
jgi:hypothetical protein